jgi:plastocyanin
MLSRFGGATFIDEGITGGSKAMRSIARALVASASLFAVACGGGDKGASGDSAVTTNPAPATTPAAGAGVAAAPATGATVEVKMVQTPAGTYEFQPKDVTIKAGDAIKWTVVSGGPHNVAFDPATVPAPAKDQLQANMVGAVSELSSPMLMAAPESFTISFANIPPGKYDYFCTPHKGMGMTGTITVQ